MAELLFLLKPKAGNLWWADLEKAMSVAVCPAHAQKGAKYSWSQFCEVTVGHGAHSGSLCRILPCSTRSEGKKDEICSVARRTPPCGQFLLRGCERHSKWAITGTISQLVKAPDTAVTKTLLGIAAKMRKTQPAC